MENQVNKRRELKYLFDKSRYSSVKKELLINGYYKHHDKNYINNLYFDKKLKSFYENIEGLAYRKKFRFRWYDGNSIVLEEKIKEGNTGYKLRYNTKIGDINKINFEQFNVLNNYKPIIYNRYLREYFINSKGVRITLDSLLTYIKYNSLKKYYSTNNILEIKYPLNEFPEENIISKLNLRLTKFSKYLDGFKTVNYDL
jgi:hypothetical protein